MSRTPIPKPQTTAGTSVAGYNSSADAKKQPWSRRKTGIAWFGQTAFALAAEAPDWRVAPCVSTIWANFGFFTDTTCTFLALRASGECNCKSYRPNRAAAILPLFWRDAAIRCCCCGEPASDLPKPRTMKTHQCSPKPES
jgi:hypothetical protein